MLWRTIHWCLTQRALGRHLREHEAASPAAPEPKPGNQSDIWMLLIIQGFLCITVEKQKLYPSPSLLHHNTLYLFSETAQFCCSWIHVDYRFVFNLASSVSVAQCVDGLLHVGVCRTDACNHQSVTVATQRVWWEKIEKLPKEKENKKQEQQCDDGVNRKSTYKRAKMMWLACRMIFIIILESKWHF